MNVNVFVCRKVRRSEQRPAIDDARARAAAMFERRITNLGCRVRFLLDGQEFERRVTRQPDDPARDINAGSPVGRALLVAREGDEVEVETPGGCAVVKVLGIR